MREERGGHTLKSGVIGKVNCLRQQILLPGETADISIKGTVRLEGLRERDNLRVNAHLAVFMTPIRWLWGGWPQYIKDGPSGVTPVPTVTISDLARYGIGAQSTVALSVPTFLRNNPLRVYNEWYKWPEDADIAAWPTDGGVAVPLQHAWNRCRYNKDPADADDYTLASATDFDVRDLAALQARFRSAMERDVLSYNRYMELIGEMYNADGSREVDQVPMMIDQQSIGVDPRELPATDGASLGQWQSVLDFDVDHQLRGVVCPEHCVLSYFLTVRFAPIIEAKMPLANEALSWDEYVGDPEMLQAREPVAVRVRDVAADQSVTQLGYLPAGWQWRSGHDVVGERVDVKNSFPYQLIPTSQANAKDATRIKDAFRSQSLGDYVADVYIKESTRSPIAGALESYFSGMTGKGSKAEFPKQGKML
jgi:hypothetical protein